MHVHTLEMHINTNIFFNFRLNQVTIHAAINQKEVCYIWLYSIATNAIIPSTDTHSVNTLKAVINFESKGNASGISDFTEMEKGTTPGKVILINC